MKPCKVFTSISPCLISKERWNIMKLQPSQRRTRDPEQMFPNMNKCENGWSNFSASFRVVVLKLTELIQFAFPHQWFLQYPTTYVPLHREWRLHELTFSWLLACGYFLYTLLAWRYVAHMLDLMILYITQRKQYMLDAGPTNQRNHRVGAQQESGYQMRIFRYVDKFC